MDPQEFLERVNEYCPEIIEPSWIPQKSLKSKRPATLATKFGGCTPWVSSDWSWPQCSTCDRPTSFFLQINLNDLPTELKTKTKLSSGLLQIFDCTGCFKWSRRGFGSTRIIPQEDLQISSLQYLAAGACPDSAVSQLPPMLQKYVGNVWYPQESPLEVFKEYFVGDWKKNDILEILHNDEWELLNAAANKLGMEPEDIEDIDYMYLEGDNEVKLGGPSQGTKVGGWFDWNASLGYPGYPKCSECSGNPLMNTVFLQFSISDLFPAHELSPLKSSWYPDFIFVSICPSCHNPVLFESFPPPLISR